MYLSRIDLHGFKSFADKTRVHFDPGVTAIVGPNGAGKSNIIDAVRWVLGEQRARLLRSEKMENVIFNGTATRRALGLAEVSLTVENTRNVLPTEYTTVTVTRRLYRSGESDYLLNGTVCRLKDILDLFMDTGMGAGAYSVIELKMIEDILSESPQDRRRLFEEAAGITKYKLRRTQALRRLDATESDLTRIADLADEIEKNVKSLARQARRAERHRDLAARLRDLELALAFADHERLATEKGSLEARLKELAGHVAERSARLQAREAEAETRRAALLEQERRLSEQQHAHNRLLEKIRRAEAEARLAAERRAAAEDALARLARDEKHDEARRAALAEEHEALAARIAEARGQAEAAAAERAERAEARNDAAARAEAERQRLRAAGVAAHEAAAGVAAAEGRIEAERRRLDLLEAEIARVEEAQREIEGALTERAEAAEAAEARLEEALAEREAAEAALAEAEAEAGRLEAALAEAEARLREARRREDAARAEADVLQALLDSYEGFDDAVQSLLTKPDWAEAPTTVADLLTCDPEHRRALDAALGPFAACIAVETEAEAYAGAERLREADAGRATFLVLSRVPERSHRVLSPTPPGATPASEIVRVEPRHRRLVRLFLENTFLVDDLAEAERLRADFPVARFVTPSGEWLSESGALRAGAEEERTASAERIGRREQREAAEALAEREAAEAERLEAEAARLRAEREGLELEARRRRQREAAREAAEREREAEAATYDARLQEVRREELWERRAGLHAQREAAADTAALEAALAEARAAHEAAREAHAEAEREAEAAEAEAREARARYDETHLRAAQAEHRLETFLRERERAHRSVEELEARAEERAAEAERLRAAQAEAAEREAAETARAAELRQAKAGLDEAVREAENAALEARAAISDTETIVREVRRLREEALQERAAADVRRTELETRIEALAERLWDEHEVALAELDPPPAGFEAEAARAEIPELRQGLRTLGAVNELALESYEQEKERLDFFRAQQRDLEAAEASLRATIREINTTAAARFDDTFQAIRSAFQRLFADLFGESASADLVLAGEDPLEDDIEIRARPRGKRPTGIAQLSGGEKTLTAIALLFAIYLVKPSPFCILDEVDAPLDDANIERFMRLIRSFSETTQFILVTHNKLTMEAADRLYGVTMPEEGVSKLVGVRFDEVEEAQLAGEAA